MTCLFCDIGNKATFAEIVFEDDLVVAFLDLYPIRSGHLQIIPRSHHPYFDDLPALVASRIVTTAQVLAKSLKELTGVSRVAFLFTGGDIAHAHAHLVPMQADTDITSRQYIAEEQLTFRAMPRATNRELTDMGAAIRATLA